MRPMLSLSWVSGLLYLCWGPCFVDIARVLKFEHFFRCLKKWTFVSPNLDHFPSSTAGVVRKEKSSADLSHSFLVGKEEEAHVHHRFQFQSGPFLILPEH